MLASGWLIPRGALASCSATIFCPDGATMIQIDGEITTAGCKIRSIGTLMKTVVKECPAPPGCSMEYLWQHKGLGGDGCSSDPGPAMERASVLSACYIHDMCYAYPKASKAACDVALGANRRVTCIDPLCESAAWQEGVLLVVNQAKTAYTNGQAWGEQHCVPHSDSGEPRIDAALNWTQGLSNGGKAYFFQAKKYGRYDLKGSGYDSGFPKGTQGGWKLPNSWNGEVDAAVNWGNGTAFLFKGTKYVKYDLKANAPGPEKDTQTNWRLPESWGGKVDAAVNWGNGFAFLFSGVQYVKYALNADRPADHPHSTAKVWVLPAGWKGRVDAAVNWGNGFVYLFRGEEYVRYKTSDLRPDGAPKSIAVHWKIPAKS